jgi:hypothetical protein
LTNPDNPAIIPPIDSKEGKMELNYGETWIEIQVQAKIDRLDALYLAGKITEKEYADCMDAIEDWGDERYANLKIKS